MPYTAAQREAIRKRLAGQRSVKVEGIQSPRSLEAAYYKDLVKISNELLRLTKVELVPYLRANESEYAIIDSPIEDNVQVIINSLRRQMAEVSALSYATKMANNVETFNRRKFVASLNKAIGVNLKDVVKKEGVTAVIQQRVADNVALIKTIPEQYFDRLEASVLQGLRRGDDFFSIYSDILEINGDKYRAKLIARDQVSKMNAALTEARQKNNGITHYFWRTSGDKRVRPSHREKNGERIAWDYPPADTGHAGFGVQCRCYAEPDLSHLILLS